MSLDADNYTITNALLWGNFLEHCNKAAKSNQEDRVVHIIMAALEFLPIISQIVSIAEMIFASLKDASQNPDNLTDRVAVDPSVKITDESTKTQAVNDEILQTDEKKKYIAEAKYIENTIDARYSDKFNQDDKCAIRSYILANQYKEQCLSFQNFIDAEWDSIITEELDPNEALKRFRKLEDVATKFDNHYKSERWKKIVFRFVDHSLKEYPYYLVSVLTKASTCYTDGGFWTWTTLDNRNNKIVALGRSEKEFEFLLKQTCPNYTDEAVEDIESMSIEQVNTLLEAASALCFAPIEGKCFSRLISWIAKAEQNKENFEDLVSILKSLANRFAMHHNSEFLSKATVFCSEYLKKLESGEKLQEALIKLSRVDLPLKLPPQTSDDDLQVLNPYISSLDLSDCSKIKFVGKALKFSRLKFLKITHNNNMDASHFENGRITLNGGLFKTDFNRNQKVFKKTPKHAEEDYCGKERLEIINAKTSLETLIIDSCENICDKIFEEMKEMTKLKTLELTNLK